MTTTVDELAHVLLAKYESLTKLVYLLKQEQQSILQRKTDVLIELLGRIEEQLPLIDGQRRRCAEILKELIPAGETPKQAGLGAWVSLLPEAMRERIFAIAQRVDVQLLLVHEFALQNHTLLSHSLHFLKEVLAPWIDPENQTISLYGKGGSVIHKTPQNQTLFQATA